MKIFAMTFAAALAISGLSNAQSGPGLYTVRFDTPVVAAGTRLPAGGCTIQVQHGSNGLILAIRSETGDAVSVLANRLNETGVETDGQVKVVLSRHRDTYHLSRILLPDRTGFRLVGSE